MGEAQQDSERVTSFKGGSESVDASEERQLLLTINKRGKIVRVEKIEKSGANEELDEEKWTKLVGGEEVEEIESGLEEAFEMGVASALGEEYEGDESGEDEDDEERALRRLLIRGLLRRPVQQRILQRLLVSRLLRRRALKRRKHS
jgi:hypothetical protein